MRGKLDVQPNFRRVLPSIEQTTKRDQFEQFRHILPAYSNASTTGLLPSKIKR